MNPIGTNSSVSAGVGPPPAAAERYVAGSETASIDNSKADNTVFSPVEESPASLPIINREEKPANASDAATSLKDKSADLQQQNDRRLIAKLAARDREVRAHEQAHASVGGQYAGAPSYSFQRGPDGVNYAVGGEVSISLSSGGGDPRQSLAAAEQVRRAALAPADPSAQDRRVAAAATVAATQARVELATLAAAESQSEREASADKGDEQSADNGDASNLKTPLLGSQSEKEQQLQDIRAASLRSAQLGEQLITSDQIRRNSGIGSVVDQRA